VKPIGKSMIGNKAKLPLKSEATSDYVQSFTKIYVEGFANERPELDSIKQSKPVCEITVSPKHGDDIRLTIHYMPLNKRSKVDEKGKAFTPYDPDRFYAFINDGKDMVVVQRFVLGKLFKTYDDFFQQPPKTEADSTVVKQADSTVVKQADSTTINSVDSIRSAK